MTRFDEVDPLHALLIDLFSGCGYNFYRVENQLRADDQRVRAMACDLLGRARAAVTEAESTFRREQFPPPTRQQPFPAPALIVQAQALERLGRELGALEGQVRSQPVPESDRLTRRYREEAATLAALADQDLQLVGQAERLRALVEGVPFQTVLAQQSEIETGIGVLQMALRERRMLLL